MVLSKDTFSELDSWLASELHQRGKKFFFVRTFMDRTLEEEEQDNDVIIKEKDEKGEFTTDMIEFMTKIREDCCKGLKFSKIEDVQIYLISNWHKHRFEFSKLLLAMSDHFSTIQKEAFLYSTNVGTEEIYKAKKEILQKRIFFAALGSGVAGAMPFPGSGLMVDIPLIMTEIDFYKTQFNLDDNSLKTYFNHEELAGLVKSIASAGTSAYVTNLFKSALASEVMEESSKMLTWVTLGLTSVIAGTASFGTTYYVLNKELDKIIEFSKQLLHLKLKTMME